MELRSIVKTREKWKIVLLLILVALMLWRTVVTAKWVYIPILVLVALACFFRRENIISERGVEIRNMLFGKTVMTDLWKWSEVSSIEANYQKKAPNVQLLISKDIVIRDFTMTRSDAAKALNLAYRMNPAIRNNE